MTDWTKVIPPQLHAAQPGILSHMEAELLAKGPQAWNVNVAPQLLPKPASRVWPVAKRVAVWGGMFLLLGLAAMGLRAPRVVTHVVEVPKQVTIERIVPVEKQPAIPQGFCLLTDPKCLEATRLQICDLPKQEPPQAAPPVPAKRKGKAKQEKER